MLRKYALFIGVAAVGALVTSCGSDDTGTPTPTDTSTETATPTPTPTQSEVDFDLTMDFATESTNANLSVAFFTPDGGGDETFSGASRLNGGSSISLAFSPELVTFGFADLDDPVTFDDGDFVSGTATMRNYVRGTENLVMELPSDHVLRVTYESQTDFTRDTTDGTLRAKRVALFFNPVSTDASALSDSTYTSSVQVFGGDPTNTAPGVISAPDFTLTVDASAPDISGTIEIFEDVNGTQTLVASFDISATLNGNGTFTGTVTDAANNFTGSLAGSLSGPNREEVFLLFSISGDVDDTDDRRFVGTVIGKR